MQLESNKVLGQRILRAIDLGQPVFLGVEILAGIDVANRDKAFGVLELPCIAGLRVRLEVGLVLLLGDKLALVGSKQCPFLCLLYTSDAADE